MKNKVEKSKENTSRAAATTVRQNKNDVQPAYEIADNRQARDSGITLNSTISLGLEPTTQMKNGGLNIKRAKDRRLRKNIKKARLQR